jgi:hypothetical protein
VTTAWKFLRPGAVGPFSGHAWAARGWVADVSACTRAQLPWWICEELWEVELDGAVETTAHKQRAERGRLVRRLEAWTPEAAAAFAAACAERAAGHAVGAGPIADGMARDGATRARAAASLEPYAAAQGAAVSAYIAAMTARRVGGDEAFAAERAWQAERLAFVAGIA